jgi:glycolate oxidase iron-sulfur subunit
MEAESPRGRIYFAREIEEGRLALTNTVRQHWDLCLQCRACEAVCPSGVPFGRIMEHSRAQARAADRGGAARVRQWLLRYVVARPGVLAAALAPVRRLANSPLRNGVEVKRLTPFLGPIGRGEAQLPARLSAPLRAGDALDQPAQATRDAILFTGCVMGELFGDVHRATARVLARGGIACTATAGQGCCGALHAHDGDLETARALARANVDALGGSDTPIVVNSAGCGAAMKEYGDLLSGDPAYADRARSFAARVVDFSEIAVSLPHAAGVFPARVAYQDACHLAHAQRIREQPRDLLRGVEGCELVETDGADMCCGAAGIYSLVQPAMSARLRAKKGRQFKLHRPDVIVTANPGCQMQYEAAIREAGVKARVLHLAEFLDEAQRNAEG